MSVYFYLVLQNINVHCVVSFSFLLYVWQVCFILFHFTFYFFFVIMCLVWS